MANADNTVETPRRRGRPAAFPGQETVQFLSNIPTETREMIREIASKRDETINAALDRVIRSAHKQAMRSRSKRKANTDAA